MPANKERSAARSAATRELVRLGRTRRAHGGTRGRGTTLPVSRGLPIIVRHRQRRRHADSGRRHGIALPDPAPGGAGEASATRSYRSRRGKETGDEQRSRLATRAGKRSCSARPDRLAATASGIEARREGSDLSLLLGSAYGPESWSGGAVLSAAQLCRTQARSTNAPRSAAKPPLVRAALTAWTPPGGRVVR